MKGKINTGIIGFGLSGRVFHAPFVHTHPDFALSAVVERHRDESSKVYPHVRLVRDYHELLEDAEIELLVITTPNHLHFQMAEACLKAGKHIVMEKPFTVTTTEADGLIRLSENTGKQVFVYQNRRWDGDFLTIRKLADQGVFGLITSYDAHFDRFRPELKEDAWREENIPGAGILYDLGPHLIDQALVLFGMPDAIRAEVRAEREGSKVDDAFYIEMLYPKNKAVVRAGMLVKDPGPRYRITGTHASFFKYGLDPQEASLKAGEMPDNPGFGLEDKQSWGKLLQGEGARQQASLIPTEKGNYMAFYDHIHAALRKDKPFPVLPQQARDVIFIIEKAFESSNKNQEIMIKKTK